jgi:hypothetical protein
MEWNVKLVSMLKCRVMAEKWDWKLRRVKGKYKAFNGLQSLLPHEAACPENLMWSERFRRSGMMALHSTAPHFPPLLVWDRAYIDLRICNLQLTAPVLVFSRRSVSQLLYCHTYWDYVATIARLRCPCPCPYLGLVLVLCGGLGRQSRDSPWDW